MVIALGTLCMYLTASHRWVRFHEPVPDQLIGLYNGSALCRPRGFQRRCMRPLFRLPLPLALTLPRRLGNSRDPVPFPGSARAPFARVIGTPCARTPTTSSTPSASVHGTPATGAGERRSGGRLWSSSRRRRRRSSSRRRQSDPVTKPFLEAPWAAHGAQSTRNGPGTGCGWSE
jgi:hypothetical protein